MIPEAFLARMKNMPELDFDAFACALEKPAVRAMRVNTLKAQADAVRTLLPFPVDPLPFAENCFYAPEDKVGALPAHHAGMIYMQDPGAISSVCAAAPKSGSTVLDLCAAPGGKSTQLAAAIAPNGILVSNEYVPARAKILQGNIERLGCPRAIVTNLSTDQLADFYGSYFDLVVADVPCSGEGMLRKYEVAGEEWSEENVRLCAERGWEILQNAARCVKPGGRLLYSTCTFAPEENEQQIDRFLCEHPDFSLLPVAAEIQSITANGVNFEGLSHDMTPCRRFYPHVSPGEGQFVALLQRAEDAPQTSARADAAKPLDKKDEKTVRDFLSDVLVDLPDGRLVQSREDVYLTPDIPVPPRGVFAPGVCVGTLQKGRIVPHHQLFSAFGKQFRRQIALYEGDPRVSQYLRGEEIDGEGENGICAILYEGAPLGGGKLVGTKVKNYYPKGLRNRA